MGALTGRPGRIVVTGGTGFVGRALCERLATLDSGCRVVVPTRRLPRGRAIQMLPNVDLVRCELGDEAQVAALLDGTDVLVHLVAILHGRPADFDRVHVQLPRRLAGACRAARVARVVHVSALGVGPDAPSHYLRTKAAGETAWSGAGGDLWLLRPSVIFGAEDRFTNLFAGLQRIFPVLPLAGAHARFQPVWVGDVAQALARCALEPDPFAPNRAGTAPGESARASSDAGQVVECGGPEVMTLREIVRRVGRMAGCARPVIGLPDVLGRLQAAALGLLPGEPLMSGDNLLSMRVPNVASGRHPGLPALGIAAQGLGLLAGHFARR